MECKPSSVYTMTLDGDAQLVGLPEGPARVVHPNHGEHGTQEDDEDVPQHRVPGHHVPPAKSFKTMKFGFDHAISPVTLFEKLPILCCVNFVLHKSDLCRFSLNSQFDGRR